MTGAVHMLVGAAIVQKDFYRPVLLGLAFASHFLLDAIPHFELGIRWNILLAAAVGLYLWFAARQKHNYYLLLGGFLAVFPDISNYLDMIPALNAVHGYFHFQLSTPAPVYLIFTEVVGVAAWLFYKAVSHRYVLLRYLLGLVLIQT